MRTVWERKTKRDADAEKSDRVCIEVNIIIEAINKSYEIRTLIPKEKKKHRAGKLSKSFLASINSNRNKKNHRAII